MHSPIAKIQQAGQEIGWSKLGALAPTEGDSTEITLHDVQMIDSVDFDIEGPFGIKVEDKRYDNCKLSNFRRLRPGCTYDRVIFTTESKPKLERTSPPESDEGAD